MQPQARVKRGQYDPIVTVDGLRCWPSKPRWRELENGDLPETLDDWPSGPAKYETFGLDDDAYGEGATAKLGPPDLERHSDGSITIGGEQVDNPDDYKGEPITGGLPTDD